MNNVKTRDFKHVLPPLPYDYVALEPYIDARTMMLHRDKHHASYAAKLNSALEKPPPDARAHNDLVVAQPERGAGGGTNGGAQQRRKASFRGPVSAACLG